ncbi:MAG: hypothetical protein PHR68_03625, partial [Candidatus Gracilibacteria bacterium]|nr:hypothetical protein [Candidatus Gracilibacteria bacterium]
NYSNSLTGGLIGKALKFNGSTDFIEIKDSQSLKLSKTATFISNVKILGTNINPISCTGQYGTILSKRVFGTTIVDYQNFFEFDTMYFFGRNNDNSPNWYPGYKTNFNSEIGKNYIYTTIYNNGETKNYINGKYYSSNIIDYGKSDTGTLSTSTGTLLLGSRNGGCVMNGIIDDIKIYNRALSDQEISQQAKIAGF